MPVLFRLRVRSGAERRQSARARRTRSGVGRPYDMQLAVRRHDAVVSQLRAVLAELD